MSYKPVKHIRKFLIPVFLAGFLLSFFNARAQNNTLYPMHEVPASVSLNPAVQYRCRYYIQLPVLSSFRLALNHTGFGYNNLFTAQADTFTPDLDGIYKKLKKNNFLRFDMNFNILGVGFWIKKMPFHFQINNNTAFHFQYPRGLLGLKDGNWDLEQDAPVETIDLSGIGLHAVNYTNIALGASRRITEELVLGARVKYILGAANLQFARSIFRLNTSMNPLALGFEINYLVNSSFPVQLGYDENGLVSSAQTDFSDPLHAFLLNKNRGLGLDLGAIYEYTDRITFSASLLDLGFIRWRTNVNNFQARGEYSYSGIDLRPLAEGQAQASTLDSLVTSVQDAFEWEGSQNKYFTGLSTKLYLSGTYRVINNLQLGALARLQLYGKSVQPSFSLLAKYTPIRWFTLSLNQSYTNYTFNNTGLGLSFGHKGAQFYLVTDNIPFRWVSGGGAFWPYSARKLDLRFGLHIIFGCKKKGKGTPGSRATSGCGCYWLQQHREKQERLRDKFKK
jgi:hypothetical protein